MPANNPYQSSLSGIWRSGQMPKPKRQGALPLDQAYGVLQGIPNSARGLPGAVGASGAARPMSGLPGQSFARSPQMYAFDEMYADVSQIPGMLRSLSGAGRGMSGAGGLSGAASGISAQGIGQSIAGAAQAIPGSARNLSEAVGLSGAMRGETGGVPSSPMSGSWQSSTVQPQPQQGGKPLDGFVGMLGRIRSTLGDLGGARGGEIQYEPLEPPASYATRPVSWPPSESGTTRDVGMAALNAAGQVAQFPMNAINAVAPLPGAAVRGAYNRLAGSDSAPQPAAAQPQPVAAMQQATIPDSMMGMFQGPQSLAESRLPKSQAPPQPMRPPAPQGMDPGVPLNASPLSPPVQQQPQPMNPQFAAAGQLADQIAARRAAGLGVGAGPTAQDMEQRAAAVQAERMNNPNLRGLGDFMQGEVSARTEAGREARRQAMDQSFLSKPMQGGGFSMADREARLSMLSPPGQRAQADSDFMARRAQTGSSADAAVREELMRQGVTQEQLDNIADLRNDPGIATGGRRAVSLLAPGTSIRTPEGGFIMRGQGRETTPEDLERQAAGRIRDRFAPQERMARMRAGRQEMMARRDAAEREMFNMRTNPLANPMLVAGNPRAMEAVINARSQMQSNQALIEEQRRQFEEGGPVREAQIAAARAQQVEAESNARNLEAQGKMLADPNQARRATIEGMLTSLQGATDQESIDLRRRLVQEYSSLIAQGGTGAAAGPDTGALLPPVVQAPLRDPETKMIPGKDIEVQIKQHAANGLGPQEIVSKLEESGIDRASIIEYLRSVPDSFWQGMTRPEAEMNTLRGIRPILGLEPDEGAWFPNPWAPSRPKPISMPMPPSRGGALMPPPQRGTRY